MSDEQLKRVEAKVDKVLEHVASLDVTVAKQEVHLAEHMRRTAINEIAIEHVRATYGKLLVGVVLTLLTAILAWKLK